MNIWFIKDHAAIPSQSGHTRHYSLGKYLARKGHHVRIITSDINYHTSSQLDKTGDEEVEGVYFTRLKVPAPSQSYIRRIYKMLVFSVKIIFINKRFPNEKPDVIVGSSPDLFCAFAAKLLAKKLNTHFVVEIRDIWPQILIDIANISANNPMIKIMKFIELKLYAHSNALITLMSHSATYFSDYGMPLERIKYIPNGIDFELLPKNQIVQKDKNAPFIVLYAGVHGHSNGLDDILRAAQIIQNEHSHERIEFWFLGDGFKKPALMHEAKSLGLNNVHFFDALPKSETYAFMQQASVFILPLLKAEVFKYGVSPNKLHDYMALAKPIIYAVNSKNLPVTDAQCGLSIAAEDPRAIANAALSLYQLSPLELQHMGNNALQYVTLHHNFKLMSEDLEAFLLDVKKNTLSF